MAPKKELEIKQKFYETEKLPVAEDNNSDRKLFLLRLAYVILFVVAFVALLNVCLSFFAVPGVASWIVFGFFSGG